MAAAVGFKRIYNGIKVIAKSAATSLGLGEIEVLSSTNKAYFHNGTTASPIVTADHTETLTNKTFDADGTGNSITNIENADIKAAAAIDLTKLAATTVSRALVSDVSGFVSPSITTATEIGYVNGVTSSIQTQINSAVSSASSDLNTHITDPTDAHDASAISNVPSGNLIATDVQGALDELQTDVDTRATSSALTTHISDTAAHGATGAVVGTTNTQTLTNKTLTSPVINSPTGIVKGDVGLGNVDNTSDATKNSAVATLTNKTLTSPVINTPTGIVKGDVGLGNVDNTSDATKDAAVATLTNKTLTAPVIDVATLTGQGSTPANPSAGSYKAYVSTTTNKLTLLDSSGATSTVGSGSSGINYITNPDAEAGTTGWATYADAAGTSPVDGTGGSPSSTFTRSTTSPLVGTASFLWTKSAANRQGEGFSYDFTIDAGYKGQQLAINYLLEVTSGTYVTADMTVWIYDVTNSTLIQPSAYQVVNTTVAGPVQTAVFQASSSSTSYRLIVHTATTSASAYTLKFDNFSVGPQIVPVGASVTDPVAYTPTFTGFGTVTNVDIKSWRVGANLHIKGRFTAGTTTATEARITLGYNGVSGNVTSAAFTAAILGAGTAYYNQVGAAAFFTLIEPSVTYLTIGGQAAATAALTKKNGNTIMNTGEILAIDAVVPILGWSSNTIVSDSAATRSIVFKGTNAAGTSVANTGDTLIPFTSVRDTHGAWSTDTYTVKVPGDYLVSATNYFASATYASLTGVYGTIYKDGVAVSSGKVEQTQVATYQVGVETKVLLENCNVGNTIQLKLANTRAAGATTLATSAQFNHIEIVQVQGPAQIQAATNVGCTYTGTASTTGTNGVNNVVAFSTKVKDTHGAYNTSTGAYTCPAPGDYEMVAHIAVTLTPAAAANGCYIVGMKNSTSTATIQTGVTSINTTAQAAFLRLAFVFRDCVAGDALYVGVNNGWNTTNNVALNTSGVLTNMSIQRLSGVN